VDGSSRVDALLVADRISGFEIKSDLDSLARLPRQVLAYSAVVERCGARRWGAASSCRERNYSGTGGAFGWRPGDGTKVTIRNCPARTGQPELEIRWRSFRS